MLMLNNQYLYRKESDNISSYYKSASKVALVLISFLFSNNIFSSEQQAPVITPEYSAQIQRTSHGVAHITAKDLPSAWFGQGYAMAEDRICTVLDQVIKIHSMRASFFGSGESNKNIDSDFGYLHLGLVAKAKQKWKNIPDKVRNMLTAHATGINAYIAAVGSKGLPEPCRNKKWVIEITPVDLLAYSMDFSLTDFSKPLLKQITHSFPPNFKSTSPTATIPSTEVIPTPIVPKRKNTMGSNGWGLGADLTESGNGILFANPHLPWEGELKLWESHITVPGEIDVYGVTLPGIPNTVIGFNNAVAWTLAVTPAAHETFYKLKLAAGEPTKYLYDGKVRSMKAAVYTIDVLNIDSGKTEQKSRTLWHSHFGPIVTQAPFAVWNKENVLSYRDANLDYGTYLSQFLEMSQAKDLNGFIDAHKKSAGIPFSHTIATSRTGDAWFTDSSPVPNISSETYAAWKENIKSDNLVTSLWRLGEYVFDGSTSRDEWVDSPGPSASGLIPFADKPQLQRRDFVFNSNDNHWLTNPDDLLEGMSPLYGAERTPRSLRTRTNANTLIKKKDENGKFSLEKVMQASLSNRSLSGKLLRAELVKHCRAMPAANLGDESVDLTKACEVLADWDETFDLDSKGAVLFREFLGTFDSTSGFTDAGTLFAEPFDPENPIKTPRGLAVAEGEGGSSILLLLAQAIKKLTTAGFSINSTLREMQYTLKNGVKIPIHGGNEKEGLLNITGFINNSNTALQSTIPNTKNILSPSTGLTKDGYLVNAGTSFLMAVELTDDGPQCQAILTHSQSDDQKSPFFADQTKLFSEKKWHQCLYDQKAIAADPKLKTYSVHSKAGDIDRDGDVDRVDIMLIRFTRKVPVNDKIARFDLNKDGNISSLDVQSAINLCSYSQCGIK